MNVHKRQSIQKVIIEQAGQERLILNDLILSSEGAEILAELIPQYHSNTLTHLEIKGNNIDSDGFQMIFTSLMCCPHLKSIEAEWNGLGSGSPLGFEALSHLVKNSRFLEFLDLKNNRIAHNKSQFITEIIQINNRSLKVVDLRWNELGEIGAQAVLKALAYNSSLKYVGLQDNRISMHTLSQIEAMLRNVGRGSEEVLIKNRNSSSAGHLQGSYLRNESAASYFPISQDTYPSMDLQVHNAQMRSKLEAEQNEAEISQSKLKLEIDRVLQKIKSKGLRSHELQLKFDSLRNENTYLMNQLRQSERLLALQKERHVGADKRLNVQKSSLRTEKYNMNLKVQTLMEKNVQKYQREMQDLENVMNDKMERLNGYYRQRNSKKRSSRQKLTELKEDIAKLRLQKELAWDKVTDLYSTSNKNVLQDRCINIEELIAKAQFQLKSEIKRGEYLSSQLASTVLKGLEREEMMESQIFETQNEIKDKHNQMGTANVEIQENLSKSALLESKTIDRESNVEMRRKYVKYVQSQSNVNVEIQRLKQEEDFKGERLLSQTMDMRIADLEKALRIEQSQNKMIQNQYDKLLAQVEGATKKTIQNVLFEK